MEIQIYGPRLSTFFEQIICPGCRRQCLWRIIHWFMEKFQIELKNLTFVHFGGLCVNFMLRKMSAKFCCWRESDRYEVYLSHHLYCIFMYGLCGGGNSNLVHSLSWWPPLNTETQTDKVAQAWNIDSAKQFALSLRIWVPY